MICKGKELPIILTQLVTSGVSIQRSKKY